MASGGYDLDFVDPVSKEFDCCVCLSVLKDPVQLEECGHRFCYTCFNQLTNSINSSKRCPLDQQIINVAKSFRDQGVKRYILNLKVRCCYSRNGCEWVNSLKEYENHVPKCFFKEKGKFDENQELLKYKSDNEALKQQVNQLSNRLDEALRRLQRIEDFDRKYFQWTITNYSFVRNIDCILSPKFYLRGYLCELRVEWFGQKLGRIGLFLKIEHGIYQDKEPRDEISVLFYCTHQSGANDVIFDLTEPFSTFLTEYTGTEDFLNTPKLREYIINDRVTFGCKML